MTNAANNEKTAKLAISLLTISGQRRNSRINVIFRSLREKPRYSTLQNLY